MSPATSPPIFHVAAFVGDAADGNPAAVCLPGRPVDERWMQRVARDMNLSETAFVEPRADASYGLRWFTPACEVDLCGHGTLAAAHVLWSAQADREPRTDELRFSTASGMLTATRHGTRVELDFPARPASAVAPPPGLLPALGLPDAVFVGVADGGNLLVVVEDQATVRAIAPDARGLGTLDAHGVIVTAPGDDEETDVVSRYFAPRVGIDEDPVTGSAHCTVGPYWADRLGRAELRAYQASARGGRLGVRVVGDRVHLSGLARTTMSGVLHG